MFVLDVGDLEDYYPRKLVVEFAKEWGLRKGNKKEALNDIEKGKMVRVLNELLGVDWWKRLLSEKVIEEMSSDELSEEIGRKLSLIYDKLGADPPGMRKHPSQHSA